MLLLLLACKKEEDISGTWMFTETITAPTGEECISNDIRHNFTDAYPPEPVEEEEDPWTSETEQDLSPQIFFGRLEEATGGMVLILGTAVYPGESTGENAWSFSWTRETSQQDETAHASGYLLSSDSDSSTKTSIVGSFKEGAFAGQLKTDSISDAQWTESDTWSDEASATLGTTGLIPASTYLVRLDGTGVEVPASNDYATFDCDDSDCTLSVSTTCDYAYTLTGVQTSFTPDDQGWTEDAGQPAGN